jgi:hypothetical protein
MGVETALKVGPLSAEDSSFPPVIEDGVVVSSTKVISSVGVPSTGRPQAVSRKLMNKNIAVGWIFTVLMEN